MKASDNLVSLHNYYICVCMYKHTCPCIYKFLSEWLFVRARTDRILAIRTAYDHATIQVVSRDEFR